MITKAELRRAYTCQSCGGVHERDMPEHAPGRWQIRYIDGFAVVRELQLEHLIAGSIWHHELRGRGEPTHNTYTYRAYEPDGAWEPGAFFNLHLDDGSRWTEYSGRRMPHYEKKGKIAGDHKIQQAFEEAFDSLQEDTIRPHCIELIKRAWPEVYEYALAGREVIQRYGAMQVLLDRIPVQPDLFRYDREIDGDDWYAWVENKDYMRNEPTNLW